MGKDESEMVALKEEPGYGGTDAEESKIDISDFKPAAPTWVLDGSLRAWSSVRYSRSSTAAASCTWTTTRRIWTRCWVGR